MLTNLMGVARDASDAETMLKYVDTMAAIDENSGEFRWFRAVLRFQTQRHAEAYQDTTWLLDKRPAEVNCRRSASRIVCWKQSEPPAE